MKTLRNISKNKENYIIGYSMKTILYKFSKSKRIVNQTYDLYKTNNICKLIERSYYKLDDNKLRDKSNKIDYLL